MVINFTLNAHSTMIFSTIKKHFLFKNLIHSPVIFFRLKASTFVYHIKKMLLLLLDIEEIINDIYNPQGLIIKK